MDRRRASPSRLPPVSPNAAGPRETGRAPDLASAAALVLVLLLPAAATAQEPAGDDAPRSVRAHRVEGEASIRLDGSLDEAVWERAEVATGFLQQEPVEGGEPSQPTEVRILYDDDALYIGAMLHDSNPDGILAYQRARDAGLGTDDRFMWILDTFDDGRSAYFFEINPAALRGDGLLRAGVSFNLNKAWDGIWDAEVRRGPDGWSAEIRIPFRTLNFDPSLDQWGVNFQRTIRRHNEEMLWTAHRRNEGLFRPQGAGHLTGLEGLSQGIGLEATPYATGGWRSAPGLDTGEPDEWTGDAGFDLTYSVTPSLRASLTVNTDFAEVEVDRRRVNLTRFPLFFPEKRDFFLEGSDVFDFLPRNGVNPYFSRRIGLVEGEQVPILAGARVTGQVRGFEVGLVQVRTDDHAEGPGEDFTALRVKRSVLEESSVGVIYTRRARVGTFAGDYGQPRGQLLGADLDYFTSSFRGDRNFNFQAFYVFHTEPFPEEGPTPHAARRTRGVRMAYPNDVWNWHVSLREFGENWEPALGFSPRNGFRRLQPSLSWNPRPDSDWIRQYRFELRYEYLTDLDGLLMTRNTGLTLFGAELHSGDRIRVQLDEQFERTLEDFPIHPDATIPAGGYTFRTAGLSVRTAGRRRVSAELEATTGEFWSGERDVVRGGVTVRPYPGIFLTPEIEWNDVRLPTGSFDATVFRFEGEWHKSPDTSFLTQLQYDNVSRVVGLFSRLRWIVRPGSEVFLVFTQNWEDGPTRGLFTLERGGTVKATYTHRF